MKKKELFELYAVIKDAKISTLSDDGAMAVIKACRVIRPLVNEYQESDKDARERLKPEGLDDLIEKYNNKTLSREEEAELMKRNKHYSDQMGEFTKGIMNEDAEIEMGKLGTDDFKAFRKANDIEADKLSVVYEMMVSA